MRRLFLLWLALGMIPVFVLNGAPAEVPSTPWGADSWRQQMADDVSLAVKADPERASATVKAAVQDVVGREAGARSDGDKTVAAIVGSAVAASSLQKTRQLVAAAVGVDPQSAPGIAAAVAAVFPSGSDFDSDKPVGQKMQPGGVRVVEVRGASVSLVGEGDVSVPLSEGMFLRQGAKISTGPDGAAVLLFKNGSVVRIQPDTVFSIDKFLLEPFDSDPIDYRVIENEPSRSVTRLVLGEGKLFFEVSKLDAKSSLEFITPLGNAGIRGTKGYVQSNPRNKEAPVSFGLSSGAAEFQMTNGYKMPVVAGEVFAFFESAGGSSFIENPPGSKESLSEIPNAVEGMRNAIPERPFTGAPGVAAAQGSLSLAQQQALQDAAEKGTEALLETVEQLVRQSPADAVEIAGEAAALAPDSVERLTLLIVGLEPSQTVSVAAALAAVVPSMAAEIAAIASRFDEAGSNLVASAVAAVVPELADRIVAAVSMEFPSQAVAVALAVAAVVPGKMAEIALAAASGAPDQARGVGDALSVLAASQGDEISSAVREVIQNFQGSPFENPGALGQNPSVLNPPPSGEPSPDPTPPSPPPPSPVPSPSPNPPVSPSA